MVHKLDKFIKQWDFDGVMKRRANPESASREESDNALSADARAFSKKLTPLVAEYVNRLDSVTMARAAAAALNEQLANRDDPQSALARALNRGMAKREELKREEGGSLSAEQAARRLGMSKTAVIDRYRKGVLLGWRESRQKAIRFPVWQFGDDKTVLRGLEEVLRVLNAVDSLDDWGRIGFFLSPRASRGGKRPLDLLREGRIEEVRQMAAADVE